MSNNEQQFGLASPQSFCSPPLSQRKSLMSPPSRAGAWQFPLLSHPQPKLRKAKQSFLAFWLTPISSLREEPRWDSVGGDGECVSGRSLPGPAAGRPARRWGQGPCRGCSSPGYLPPGSATCLGCWWKPTGGKGHLGRAGMHRGEIEAEG